MLGLEKHKTVLEEMIPDLPEEIKHGYGMYVQTSRGILTWEERDTQVGMIRFRERRRQCRSKNSYVGAQFFLQNGRLKLLR